MRNILAIGAYERDNFGDYLFYEVLKRALKEDNVLPGSVAIGDVREEYGFITIPYDYVLKHHKVDAVWVVGGEVGGVNVSIALDMSLDLKNSPYERDNQTEIDQIEELFGASRRNTRAYIPKLANYELNSETVMIINSVGLSNIYAETHDNVSLLDQSKALNVRDVDSYKLANDSKTKTTLTPDVVHSLSRFYSPNNLQERSEVLVQINTAVIHKYGIDAICTLVTSLYESEGVPVVLFAAGTANGHDSIKLYQDVVDKVPEVDVSIFASRKPLDIVDRIVSAKLVVATSLHVRIIAATYGVKRIALVNDKVARYASKWDSSWPYDIEPNNIQDALETAHLVTDDQLKREDLTAMAYDNLQQAISVLPETQSAPLVASDILNDWMMHQKDISLRNITNHHEYVSDLLSTIESTKKELSEVTTELEIIKNSKAWQMIERMRSMKNQ